MDLKGCVGSGEEILTLAPHLPLLPSSPVLRCSCSGVLLQVKAECAAWSLPVPVTAVLQPFSFKSCFKLSFPLPGTAHVWTALCYLCFPGKAPVALSTSKG